MFPVRKAELNYTREYTYQTINKRDVRCQNLGGHQSLRLHLWMRACRRQQDLLCR